MSVYDLYTTIHLELGHNGEHASTYSRRRSWQSLSYQICDRKLNCRRVVATVQVVKAQKEADVKHKTTEAEKGLGIPGRTLAKSHKPQTERSSRWAWLIAGSPS